MKKKVFVAMMLAGCLTFGGCGNGSDTTPTVDSDDYEAAYGNENDSFDTDAEDSDEEYMDEETEVEEDEAEDEDEPVEAKGIIAMVRQTTTSASGGYTDVQIISIDPETGVQSIISEFHLDHITYAELQRAEEIDDTEFYYLNPKDLDTYRVYGNNRDWFSDDFTKMIATRQYPSNPNEQHAGWIDTDENFFDVSKEAGMVAEANFSNPNPTSQKARGFHDDAFSFYEVDASKSGQVDNTRKYCVPLNDISSQACSEVSSDDLYDNGEFYEYGFPTAQIDDNIYIMDSSLTCPSSFILNLETDETQQYIPESERYTWSGVLSPDGNTVAFLSIPSNGGGNVELYTVPLGGGEPTGVSVVASEDTLIDITTLSNSDLALTPGTGDMYYYLIDWR